MLIKYCVFNSTTPDITEIADITRDENNAVFTPVREDILDIIIKDISGYEYERITEKLFEHGKVDITSLKSKTFLDDTNICD